MAKRGRYGGGSYQKEKLASGEMRYWWIAPASKAGKRVKSPRFKTSDELDDWVADFTKSRGATAKRGTFAEAAELWLNGRGASPSKLAQTRGIVENHLLPVFGEKELRSISNNDVNAYITGKAAGTLPVRGQARKTASRNTIAVHIQYVRSIFDHAINEELFVGRNPAEKGRSSALKALSVQHKKVQALGQTEAARFYAAVDEEHRAHVAVMWMAGLRSGEAAALRWRDWNKGRLMVERARKADGRTVGEPKTATSSRTVQLSKQLNEVLRDHYRRQKAAGVKTGPDALMFPNPSGGVWDSSNFRKLFDGWSAAAGFDPPVRPHWLRHTFAVNQINAGTSVGQVAQQLGHKDAVITLREYFDYLNTKPPAIVDVETDVEAARRAARRANREE